MDEAVPKAHEEQQLSDRSPPSFLIPSVGDYRYVKGSRVPHVINPALLTLSLPKILPSPSHHYMSIRPTIRLLQQSLPRTRTLHTTPIRMGVTVESLSPGDGKNFPKKGDTVSMHCTFPSWILTFEQGEVRSELMT